MVRSRDRFSARDGEDLGFAIPLTLPQSPSRSLSKSSAANKRLAS
jgi:hypothetical protein